MRGKRATWKHWRTTLLTSAIIASTDTSSVTACWDWGRGCWCLPSCWGPLWGGLAFATQAVVYIFFNAVTNGAGHAVGYRSFENTATNMQLVALVTAGEGLHNNHHAYPTSARFSLRRWELDPAWPLIRLLSWAPLACPLHLAPRA